MTRRTVSNQGNSVSTLGTHDCAQVKAKNGDYCFVPPAKEYLPFDNYVYSEDLKGGTTTVTIGGQSIWTLPAKLGPTSLPAHPGTLGKRSGKPAHGEAVATKGSETLTAQGNPVIRLDDPTLQNRGNSDGIVRAERLIWDADTGGDGSGDGGAGGNAKGKGGKPKDPKPGNVGPGRPPSSLLPVDKCQVTGLYGACDHGRSPKNFYIEVTGGAIKETMWAFAGVNGLCPNQPHPDFFVNGAKQPPRGNPLECAFPIPPGDLPRPSYPLDAMHLIMDNDLKEYPSKVYEISANGCIPGNDVIKVKAFLGTSVLKRRYDINDFPDAVFVKTLVEQLSKAVTIVCDKAPPMALLEGGIDLEAQVKEHESSNIVYVEYKIAVAFDPFVSAGTGKVPIGGKAMAKLMERVYGKLGKFGEVFQRVMKWADDPTGDKAKQKAIDDANAADPNYKPPKEPWFKVVTNLPGALGQAFTEVGTGISEWGKKKAAQAGGSNWGTAAIYLGEFMKDVNPMKILEEIKSGILGAGFFFELTGTVGISAAAERHAPFAKPELTTKAGINGKLTATIGFNADLMKGQLCSFDLHGSTTITAGGAAFIDETGLGITDANLACKSLSITSRIKLLGALEAFGWSGFDSGKTGFFDDQLDKITGTMERPNLPEADTFDFIQQFPDFGNALNYKQSGKKYLYKFKG